MKKHYFDPTIHGRKSVRLPHYDYSLPGPYFVTVCLDERQPLLAIPEVRKILEGNWHALPQRYPGIKLDEFIIMPDHIHLFVCFGGGCTTTLSGWIKGLKRAHECDWDETKAAPEFSVPEPLRQLRRNYCGRGGGVPFSGFLLPPSGWPCAWPRSAAAGTPPRCCGGCP